MPLPTTSGGAALASTYRRLTRPSGAMLRLPAFCACRTISPQFTIAQYTGRVPGLTAGLDRIQHPYNLRWSCPLTPFENRVKVPIRAGEKLFASAEHE